MTLHQYVHKHGGIQKAAPRIGLHWVTLSRHLRGVNKPTTTILRNRLTALGIDLKDYPGKAIPSKFDGSENRKY